jgi:hypothetical protein
MFGPPDREFIEDLVAHGLFGADRSDEFFVAFDHFADNLEPFEHHFEAFILLAHEDGADTLLKVLVHLDRSVQAKAELVDSRFNFALTFLDRLRGLRGLSHLALNLGDIGEEERELGIGRLDALERFGAVLSVVLGLGAQEAKGVFHFGPVRGYRLTGLLGAFIERAQFLRYALEGEKLGVDFAGGALGADYLLLQVMELAPDLVELGDGAGLFVAGQPHLLFEPGNDLADGLGLRIGGHG